MTLRDEHRVRAGWAPFLQPGVRVVLRYAINRESSPHGESMSDALGTILAADDSEVRVMTRRGQVRVPRTAGHRGEGGASPAGAPAPARVALRM